MKRLLLLLVFVSLVGFLAFGSTGEQEELDFLLFLPNSGNQFVNEDRAMIQLDKAAGYLMTRNLSPGRISVYGYTAAVVNDIEAMDLSRDRALHVINELQKRGLPGYLFAEPIACGPVDLWSGYTDDEDKGLNRRVRILFDETIPATQHESETERADSEFPWWIIPLVLIGVAVIGNIMLLAFRSKRNSTEEIPMVIPAAVAAQPGEKVYVLTEEEIRRHAYELYQQCDGQNGDAVEDWRQSVRELTANYEDQGYQVKLYWEVLA